MRYLFEDYALDPERRELCRGAEVVSVAPQVFDLLNYLILNRERVVSKDTLIEVIWNGRSVSDAALTTRLNVARSAIGDSGEEQRLIKTLPRKGFRFIGAVREEPVSASVAMAGAPAEPQKPSLSLPDKPSIAVLPFTNLSSDPEQDYFADGMAEDIITALSRFHELFVIARNSSFTYKGRAVDVKQVGRELGVRYVLEGSVRKAASRIRIAGQLIDASTGSHLWADRFDRALEDIFDLQDQISASIVGAIAPKLEQAEIERARRKPTESLNAYDYYLRGMASFHRGNKKSIAEALELFNKAIQLDPGFGSAYGMAAWCHHTFVANWTGDHKHEAFEGERLARRAARLGADDAIALCAAGFVLANFTDDIDAGVALVDRALALNPNLGTAWFLSGWVRLLNGEIDMAIEHLSHVERLSPFDPLIWAVHVGIALAHFFGGRYQEASSSVELCLRDMPKYRPAVLLYAATRALAGDADRAKRTVARIRELNPTESISNLKARMPFRPEQMARYVEGLRKAGLPE